MSERSDAGTRVDGWLRKLRAQGYRLTAPRRAIVRTIAESTQALETNEIYRRARRRHAKLGLVSVYRTLEKLEVLGLVQRVHREEGGCHAYLAGFTGHQHLLLCETCGQAAYFEGDNLDGLVARVEDETGYRVGDHWLQLSGVCPDCHAERGGGKR